MIREEKKKKKIEKIEINKTQKAFTQNIRETDHLITSSSINHRSLAMPYIYQDKKTHRNIK